MKPIYTIRDLYDELASELSLTWNGEGGDAEIVVDIELQHGRQPAGPLNLIRPNQIQVIGPPERKHLLSEEKDAYHEYLQVLFKASPAALIFTDGLKPLQECEGTGHGIGMSHFSIPRNPIIR